MDYSERFFRPLDGFQKIITKHAEHGMNIVPVDTIGNVRETLRLKKLDFVVCAFMASRSPAGMEGLDKVVYLFPRILAQLDRDHGVQMPRLNGGGNKKGLMGKWALSAAEAGLAYFVITQGLIFKEELPPYSGVAACIKQMPGEDRIGERTDGLINPADFFIVFPGGTGTLLELAALLTNSSINPGFSRKKVIIFDPVFTDPETGVASRWWEEQFQSLNKFNSGNTISDDAACSINNHFIIHRPDTRYCPEQASRELIALTLLIRHEAQNYAPNTVYRPLEQHLLDEHVYPYFPSVLRNLGKVFNKHPAKWDWCNIAPLSNDWRTVPQHFHLNCT